MPDDRPQLALILEAALLAAGKPLSLAQLEGLFDEQQRPPRGEMLAALEQLQGDYQLRAMELVEVGGGYRFQVRRDYAPWVGRLWEEKPARYSRALLETLALIAYRQPITRGEIEDVRGVAVSSNIVRTLVEREWIRVVGHRDVPGRPALYATTREFLNYFNLKSLDQLPPLNEIRDLDAINRELDLGQTAPPIPAVQPDPSAVEPQAQERDEAPANVTTH
jgi:segregation and condensation protein B